MPTANQNVPEWLSLVRDGGPVVIALVVLCGLLYLVWRMVVMPGLKEQSKMAESNKEAARQHAEAAKQHAISANAMAMASAAHERMASHLERIADILLSSKTKAD